MMRYQRRCSITEHSFRLTVAAMKDQYAASGGNDSPFEKIDYVPASRTELNEQCQKEEGLRGKVNFKPMTVNPIDWEVRKGSPTFELRRHAIPLSGAGPTAREKPCAITQPATMVGTAKLYSNRHGDSSSSAVLECLQKAVQVDDDARDGVGCGESTAPQPQQVHKNLRNAENFCDEVDARSTKRRKRLCDDGF